MEGRLIFLWASIILSLFGQIGEMDPSEKDPPTSDRLSPLFSEFRQTNALIWTVIPIDGSETAIHLKRLARLGIQLIFASPPSIETEGKGERTAQKKKREKTLLLIEDFGRTGNVFQKWKELSPCRPSPVVILDDPP